jgi:hypothetical protein
MEITAKNFTEFWPYYVCEHGHPANRRIHFIGTFFTLGFLVAAIILRNYWLLIGMPLMGYGMAWFGHFFVEHNKPATFKAPIWSLMGDYKMFFLICIGKMDDEVNRCHQVLGRRLPSHAQT